MANKWTIKKKAQNNIEEPLNLHNTIEYLLKMYIDTKEYEMKDNLLNDIKQCITIHLKEDFEQYKNKNIRILRIYEDRDNYYYIDFKIDKESYELGIYLQQSYSIKNSINSMTLV